MELSLLKQRALDTVRLSETRNAPCFLGFLSPAEAAAVKEAVKNIGCSFCFFGGFEGAERLVFCCKPNWCEDPHFPIVGVTFIFRPADRLSHRDFLGALTGLGIAREKIGDILVEAGRAVAFLHKDILSFVLSQTEKIGSTGVRLSQGYSLPLPSLSKLADFKASVSSLRLDCVVSELVHVSRKEAAELLSLGYVSVNSVVCEKGTHSVRAGDSITVRRKGKFKIKSVDGITRKGKTVLEYQKYIT